jgi:hypothetical protein
MRELSRGTIPPPFFMAAKCRAVIPVRDALTRDALLQAGLTPQVRAIHYRAPDLYRPQPALSGAVLHTTEGPFLLAVCQSRPWHSDARLTAVLHREGLRLLVRDAEDICSEPRFSNTRLIWSYADYRVPLLDRLKIAAALADGGRSITEIEAWARPSCDILGAVCALACENGIEFSDIGETPLTPDTVVHAR